MWSVPTSLPEGVALAIWGRRFSSDSEAGCGPQVGPWVSRSACAKESLETGPMEAVAMRQPGGQYLARDKHSRENAVKSGEARARTGE